MKDIRWHPVGSNTAKEDHLCSYSSGSLDSQRYFPITTGFLLSPVAETKKATVNRSFYYLPPLHFFAFSKRLLSGSAR